MNLHFLSYWDTLGQADDELLQGGKRMPDDLPRHAQNSRLPSPWPSSPRTCARRGGRSGRPEPGLATAERGRSGSSGSPSVAKFVGEVIDGERQSELRRFTVALGQAVVISCGLAGSSWRKPSARRFCYFTSPQIFFWISNIRGSCSFSSARTKGRNRSRRGTPRCSRRNTPSGW